MELTVELTQGQIEGHFEGLRSSDADVRRIALVALQRLQPPALEQLFEIYDPDDHGLVWGETAANSIRFILRTIHSAMVLKLGNSDRRVRSAALVELGRQDVQDLGPYHDPVLLAQHADAVVAMLNDPDWEVRASALYYLRFLKPEARSQYADAIAAMLEDSNRRVRFDAFNAFTQLRFLQPATIAKYAGIIAATLDDVSGDRNLVYMALTALGKLEPEALVQYASSVAARLDDHSVNPGVRGRAFDILSALPHYITRGIDFTSEELRSRVVTHGDSDLRSRLVGRAGWYRYLQRMRGRPIAIYWYALPYRPGGPGYVRDVEAWDHIG